MSADGEQPLSAMHSTRKVRSQGNRGRLPLVLRMALLRRPGGATTPFEQGYAIAVALVAGFVLLLGVGALASRSNFGFIGQVFQVQNRKARDVAENAIRQFTSTVNREEYRHLLIAGDTANWNSAQFTNICTSVDASTGLVNVDADGNADIDDSYINNADAEIRRFEPSQNFVQLVAGDASREFRVEQVRFQDQGKVAYYNGTNFVTATPPEDPRGEPITFLNAYRLGNRRALVEITVIGRVTENGRTSEARIARQLEVVPKCCKRSFGQNLVGGVNWGRDVRPCPTGTNELRVGIIGGMTGGSITGSANAKPITNELGSPLSAAACWEDYAGGTSVNLGGTNPDCPTNSISVGSISFPPVKLDFVPPAYSNPAGAVTPVPLGGSKCLLGSTTTGYIYFNGTQVVYDFDGACDDTDDGVANPVAWSGLRRLDGELLDGSSTTEPDPCYVAADRTVGPYHIVHCKVQSMSPRGNTKIYVDTTAAGMNFFFEGSGGDPDFDFGVAQGTAAVLRIHRFREDLNTNDAPVYSGYECDQAPHNFTITSDCSVSALTTNASIYTSPRNYNPSFRAAKTNTRRDDPVLDGTPDYYLEWPCPPDQVDCIPDTIRLGSYLELCEDRAWSGGNCRTDLRNGKPLNEFYSVRSLLNFYSDEVGTFTLGGNASGLSMNIYAPRAKVVMNGGGNSPQYMGQIWTNEIVINGDIDIKTFSGAGNTGGIFGGRPLIDFTARSFTQSFGF